MSMAKKDKKEENKTSPSEATPWANLPRHIQERVTKKPDLLQYISYGGVEKSWKKFVPNPCNQVRKPTLPQLQITEDRKANVIDTKMHTGFSWYYHQYCEKKPFVEYSQGVLGCYIWDPLASSVILFPRWYNNIPFKHATLCPSPKNSKRTRKTMHLMVATGISHPAFMLKGVSVLSYSRNDQWNALNIMLIDPHSSTQQYMQFTNVICLEQKFYALSLQGTLVVIELIHFNFGITKLTDVSSSRAVPSVPSICFKQYLIQSNGEILLVFQITTSLTDVVDDIEIYRLLIPTLKWERVENLGDIALFIGGNCCMHVPAGKVGCKGNRVYYTKRADSGWLVYDMAKGNISPSYDTTATSFV